MRNVYLDPDPEVQADGLDLLLDTARQTRTESFHAVMDAIESLVMNSENDALCCAGMEGIASLLASTFGTFPKIEKIENVFNCVHYTRIVIYRYSYFQKVNCVIILDCNYRKNYFFLNLISSY